ncbi:MAG: hypothetical protein F6K47_01665 [Symploca sp. SIO2E6]|nr:hypothetical protein [Symploca sp. SIO2E6]
MKRQWQRVCIKVTTWLAAEIILNLLGLDNLADYSEFIFDKEVLIAKRNQKMTVVVPSWPPQSQHSLPDCLTMAPLA